MSLTTDAKPIQIHEGEDVLTKLAISVGDYRVFAGRHPRFLESCEVFLSALREFFESHPEQGGILFVHRQGEIYFRKVPLSALTPPALKLAKLLNEKDVEGIRFTPDCNLTGLTAAIEGLCQPNRNQGEPAWREVNRRLEAQGLQHMVGFFTDREVHRMEEAGAFTVTEPAREDGSAALLRLPQLSVPLEIYRSTLSALHELMGILRAGSTPGFGELLQASEQLTGGLLQGEQAFLPLTTVRYSDQFTFNHSVNVCLLTTAALKPFVTDPEHLGQIGQAALLHDLGKSLVPEDVLYASGQPSAEQIAWIEKHPKLGAELLLDFNDVSRLAAIVAFDHHRRQDGSGYPRVRRPHPIDTVTAVVAAADLFEALTAERPYKKSLSPSQAFRLLPMLPEARGLETAVRLLFDTLTPYPPGTLVELDNGERAIVTSVRRGLPDRPSVRLIDMSSPQPILADEETDLAASLDSLHPGPRVHRALPPDGAVSPEATGSTPTTQASEEEERELRRRVETGTLLVTEG